MNQSWANDLWLNGRLSNYPSPRTTAPTVPTAPSARFNLNPTPQAGTGPFGTVPGPLGLPDPYGDISHVVPGLPAMNNSASSAILSKLNGQLSPGTLNALKNAQATFGVQSGMPGSGLSWNSLFGNIAGASEAQQAQGLEQYRGFIPTVAGTQTVNPALQNEIATQNAVDAAAPNPAEAQSYAASLFNRYLNQMRGPGGGTSNSDPFGMNRIPQGGPSGSTYVPTGPTFDPRTFTSSGPSSFGGSSSYDPEQWSAWEDEMYGPVSYDAGTVQPDYGGNDYQPDLYDFADLGF